MCAMKKVFWINVVIVLLHSVIEIRCAPSADDANGVENGQVQQTVKYDGAQLWKVAFGTEAEKLTVIGLQNSYDVSMWDSNGTSVDLFLKRSAIEGAGRDLAAANVTYNVVIDDMQKQIETENPPADEIALLQNRKGRYYRMWRGYKIPNYLTKQQVDRLKGALMGYNALDRSMELWPQARWGHRLTWGAYHRVSDIHGYLDYLANTYPDLCSVQTIGQSSEGRALKVLKISNGNAGNPSIWVDGGIHAREWISPASVTYIVNEFVEEWDEQPDYIQNVDWYVLPVANPDGYEYSHTVDRLWRKNRGTSSRRCAGVDLNRNFGFHWNERGASNRPCSEIYSGARAFSEPETRAQRDFLLPQASKFQAFLTFHSYGQYILYPWGYDTTVPPDYQDLSAVGRDGAKNMKAIDGQIYSVGPSGSLLYPAAGASDDWAKSLGIKFSYTVELRDKGNHGFILPAIYIEKTAREAQAFVHSVARAVAAL